MCRLLTIILILSMSAWLTSCSSSQTSSEDESLDEATDAIAETDPAPADGGEVPGAETPTDDLASAPETPPADGSPAPAEGAPAAESGSTAFEPPPPDPAPAPAPDPAPPAAEPPSSAPVANTESVEPPPPQSSGVTPVQGNGQFSDYTVQGGDTLMKIAFETYGDLYQWRKIYRDNRSVIKNPNAVPAGTVLKLEQPSNPVTIDRNGEKYLIQPGDTLGTISRQVYGTTTKWKKIWQNNKQLIRDPNKIFAGFYLYYTTDPGEISNPPIATGPGNKRKPSSTEPPAAEPGK